MSERLPLSENYSGNDAETISAFAHPKSMPISYVATAEEVQHALDQIPHVNHVLSSDKKSTMLMMAINGS